MHSRTTATLDQLEKASWFSRVGINEGYDVAVVRSWSEAIHHCRSSTWEDLQLDAQNRYCAHLAQRANERWNRCWNDTVDEVKKTTRPLVGRKIATTVRENNLPEIFRSEVNYVILLFCMEAEFADVCPPGFFTSLGHWYLNGHFPCGWWGMLPAGRLVVY
jgi:hypothetical protein